MFRYLTYNEQFLIEKKAYWTAKEISQQPNLWRDTGKNVQSKLPQLMAWLEPILTNRKSRIILTGAGTSAYIGNALAPHLSKKQQRLFEPISTTDIVSNPELYFFKDVPTLLVSYGRSGSSPESVATVKLADQLIDDCYHLIITCNSDGRLYKENINRDNAFVLLMPEASHDKSFAMTSSFTSMYIATLSIFSPSFKELEHAAANTEFLLKNSLDAIKNRAEIPCTRLVFLGSGCLRGIAQEAALKCLELTAGKVMSSFESPLGFRHGPKSLVDNNTEIIFLASTTKYTLNFEIDLLEELKANNKALSISVIDKNIIGGKEIVDDVWVGLPYIVYCQILSFYKSLNLGISPDNPSPNGEVNRVVSGVNIYPFYRSTDKK